MIKGMLTSVAIAGMLGAVSLNAQAARVGFSQATPALLEPGESGVEFDLEGTEFVSTTDGGSFRMSWDPAVLEYVAVTVANPPWDLPFVDDSDAASGSVDALLGKTSPGGAGPGFDIATFVFNVVGEAGDSTEMVLEDIFGGWAAPGAVPIPVDYDLMDVQVVPVPAALPLLLSALGGLGFMARRRSGS